MKKIIQNKKILGISTFFICAVAVFMFAMFFSRAEKTVKYVDHTFSDINTAIKEVDEGYLYGGLYTKSVEGVQTKYTGVSKPVAGTVYQLKMVPEEILNIQAQVSDRLFDDPTITEDDETYAGKTDSSIRFVTGIDDLQYKKIGFNITVEGNSSKDANASQYVHTKLYGVDQSTGDYLSYDPADIHGSANFFKTFTLKNVPEKYYDHDLTVKAYWVTMDGTRVEGTNTIGIKTVNLGRSWVYVLAGADGAKLGTENAPFATMEEALTYTLNKKLYVILKSDMTLDNQVTLNSDVTKTTVTSWSGNPYDLTGTTERTITRGTANTGALFLVDQGQELYVTGTTTLDGKSSSSSTAAQAMLLNAGTLTIDSDVTLKNGYKKGSDNKSYYAAADAAAGAIESKGDLYINGTVTACGSNVTSAISSQGTITMNGANISSNVGRVLRLVSGSATITDSILNNNKSTGNGGAILVIAGTVEATDTQINNNTTTQNGGAIYVAKGTFEATDTQISENTANSTGGAIRMEQAGTLTLTDCTLDGNILTNTGNNYGGAISFGGYEHTVTLTGCTISNHKIATALTDNTQYGARGGALYLQGSGTITLDGCTISGNEATASAYKTNGNLGNGGGIYIYGTCTAAIEIKNCSIANNTATSEGGGIYAGSGAGTYSLTITNEKNTDGDVIGQGIYSNTAGRGGGIYSVGKGTFTMNGVPVTSNQTSSLDGYKTGAGIFANGSGAAYSLTDCYVNNNISKLEGAGILVGGNPTSFTMTGGELCENNGTRGSGMIFYAPGSLSVENVLVEGNTTTSTNGAGFYVDNAKSTATFTSSTIKDNIATGSGGAICVNKAASTTIDDCTFTGNEGTDGGAVFGNNAGTYEVTSCTFISNAATAGTGGALQVNADVTKLTMESCTFTNNVASKSGGAVRSLSKNSTVTFTGCTFTGNSATNTNKNGGLGGAVFIQNNKGNTQIDTCTFENNTTTRTDMSSTTTGLGGAVCIENTVSGNVLITGTQDKPTTFTSNRTDYRGGALYLEGTGSQTVEYTSFTGNKSADADGNLQNHGGAIMVRGTGTTEVQNCNFNSNAAGVGAGISWITSATNQLTIKDSTFTSGNSKNFAGGCYFENANGTAVLTNCDFTQCSSTDGGAVYLINGTADMTNCDFTSCSATRWAGAIWVTKGTMSLTSCEFNGNTATTQAGAIRAGNENINEANMKLSGCVFNNNSSKKGGGFYMHTGVATLTNCTFESNKATEGNAGGFSTGKYGAATLEGCIFTDNTATTTGPNIYNDGTITFPKSSPTTIGGTEANEAVSNGRNW